MNDVHECFQHINTYHACSTNHDRVTLCWSNIHCTGCVYFVMYETNTFIPWYSISRVKAIVEYWSYQCLLYWSHERFMLAINKSLFISHPITGNQFPLEIHGKWYRKVFTAHFKTNGWLVGFGWLVGLIVPLHVDVLASLHLISVCHSSFYDIWLATLSVLR